MSDATFEAGAREADEAEADAAEADAVGEVESVPVGDGESSIRGAEL